MMCILCTLQFVKGVCTPMTTVFVRRCTSTNIDISLCYDTFGSSTDPALLLVMGLNQQMIAWNVALCNILAAKGFFVIRFDNRDVGLSTKLDKIHSPSVLWGLLPKSARPKPPYTLDDMALDAIALLDALKIQQAHLFGCSMGGMIVQVMAINHPDRVLSVTSFMSTTGSSRLPGPTWRVKKGFLLQPKGQSVAQLADFRKKIYDCMIQRPETAYYLGETAEYRADAIAYYERSTYNGGVLRQLAAIQAAPGRDARLRALRVPFTVLHGDIDELVPLRHGLATAAAVPGARMVVYPGLGHNIAPQQYEEYAREVAACAARAGFQERR
jgi:pimeloyl-ACP methyl ester carboxylesterase